MATLNVRQALQEGAATLAQVGVDSARLEAEWLLAHVLGIKRLQLHVEGRRLLNQTERSAFDELLRRRASREPLQHILGSAEFCGLEIQVNRDTLIPRPETELLAERAWTWLQTVADHPPVALDFGTGSGCLAIALAVHCPAARIYALDLSASALAMARTNAARLGVEAQLVFVRSDGLAALPEKVRLDLAVANPPYIPTAQLAALQPEVRDFEPHLALDGGVDGLRFYRLLATGLGRFLAPKHRLMLELGDGQAPAVQELLTREKWFVEMVLPDYSGVARIMVARHLPGGRSAFD